MRDSQRETETEGQEKGERGEGEGGGRGKLFCRRHCLAEHRDVRTRKCAFPLGCRAKGMYEGEGEDGKRFKFCMWHRWAFVDGAKEMRPVGGLERPLACQHLQVGG
jgi:hypothetical protein